MLTLDCILLQPRRGLCSLLELVESSPELFECVVQYLHTVELQSLSASCRLLRRAIRDKALAANTQVQSTEGLLSTQTC